MRQGRLPLEPITVTTQSPAGNQMAQARWQLAPRSHGVKYHVID